MRYSIDHLIQRHLDGELSDAERREFEHLLEHSAEAREELRRAEQIRSTARRAATLHTPSAWVESELLAMIRAGAAAPAPVPVSKEAETLRPAVAHERRRRAAALFATVACLMLLVLKVSDGPLPTVGRGGIEPAQNASTIASVLPVASSSRITPVVSNSQAALPTLIRRHRVVLRDNRSNGNQSMTPEQFENQAVPTPAHDLSNGSVSIAQTSSAPAYSSSESVVVAANTNPTAPDDDFRPLASSQQASLLNASVRGGLAGIRRDDWVQMNEMQVRLGVRISKQDQLYAVVGSAPTITETRYKNSGLSVSSTKSKNSMSSEGDEGKGSSARLLSAPPPELLVTFDDEMWGGVGYRRTLVEAGGIQLAAGAQAGTSGTAARFAGELSSSVRLTSNVAIEVSGSVTQVVPFTREVELSSAVAARDRMLYNGTIRQPAFVSVGAQVGLRVDIP